MKTTIRHLIAAAVIGLSGLGATAGSAAADSITLGLHSSGPVTVQYREGRDWRHHHRPHYAARPSRGRCAPWLAADKARASGLRVARVVAVTPRRVVVEGRRYGDWRRVDFANVRGCPRLR